MNHNSYYDVSIDNKAIRRLYYSVFNRMAKKFNRSFKKCGINGYVRFNCYKTSDGVCFHVQLFQLPLSTKEVGKVKRKVV